MRLGLMIGSDKERTRQERLAGLIAVVGQATEHIELGSAVVPIQTRHPIPMAQQALTTQLACGGRFTLGLGPSHHWIVEGQLGLPYERPARIVRNYLEVMAKALAGPGQVDIENAEFRVHSPMDVADPIAMPVMIAALAPTMLRIAGEHTSGTILWMADERAIGDYIAPRITKAASDGRRPAPRIVAGGPGALCP